ncbi:MAG: hypothetical protein IPM53_18680 [Anaerolineaceae bacterium]|nr:hypothetical protein [Anaerolineaceae bacterium]
MREILICLRKIGGLFIIYHVADKPFFRKVLGGKNIIMERPYLVKLPVIGEP